MFRSLKNEKGVTLIELLTSIVILSIILLSFMTFFTNSFQYNAISSDKMKATNIAREVQEEFKVNPEKNLELKNLITHSKTSADTTISKSGYPNLNLSEDITKNSDVLTLKLVSQNFNVEVLVDTKNDPELHSSLAKINVKVKKGTKVVSEAFTYFEY
ncbi:type IV pilus modification PilV family protein [Neobacillus vireti]|uniref:type IV pilus modification PilV family protein n=1 Tax=Neobacillus vireti TaxID=220686 RepID=UPI00300002EC